MRAGSLRHVVAFDEPVTSQSASGMEVVTWTPRFSVRAAVEPLKGREPAINDQPIAQLDTRIRIRWSPQTDAITAKWRARLVNTECNIVYNIAQPPVHLNLLQREIHLYCQSGVNNG